MPPRSRKESSVDDELILPVPTSFLLPLPATALQTDRERFERALSAARAANDAERAAALAEATSDESADDAAAEAAAAQSTIAPQVAAPQESKATERDKRREDRRRAKAERSTVRAEAKQRRAEDREAAKEAKAVPESAEQAAVATPELSSDDLTALIADMPEHREVLGAPVLPAQVPDRAPDDLIVEPPPALPRNRKKSTRKEKIGVLLVGLGALGLLCSVVLAVGALLAAVEVDVDAAFAGAVSDLCDVLVGPLGGLFSFSGENAEARNDLFARGIGSMIYLAIGLFLPSVARRRDS